jgi:hypothetical protein
MRGSRRPLEWRQGAANTTKVRTADAILRDAGLPKAF